MKPQKSKRCVPLRFRPWPPTSAPRSACPATWRNRWGWVNFLRNDHLEGASGRGNKHNKRFTNYQGFEVVWNYIYIYYYIYIYIYIYVYIHEGLIIDHHRSSIYNIMTCILTSLIADRLGLCFPMKGRFKTCRSSFD